ncbi:cyclodeaminase/cyclohydrolase family protein [Shewanella sp. C32]|uniref:Cyclodeaminase/cyclohydrolase family protein n=1 Tax=Shewanella electrica TaxID=515560 RepID=A0ABT2FF02_9GAMM|nr:cyclodeaminase/cyclohydrolase family protein [Shewanella electrica]MCH1925009.1 cyclodeaminase/cyclohydrolase family protein [Shewanella electrica]MCS4554833.1 cyclodeaminase/cyclohydrolase family protein [Shewanella electrica]
MKQDEISGLTSDLILDRSTTQLLDDFGAGKASPGSGSAAALLSILSAKMILTVCDISLEKAGCERYHKEFEFITSKIKENFEPRLRELFELDARDFEKVVDLRIRRDRANDPSEKSRLSRESLELLEVATNYTFEVADISFALMEYGINIFEHGWHAVRGDSGVSISAAMSGIMSCIFITNLNLKTLKRRKYAAENLARVQSIQTRLENLQVKAFTCVTSIGAESIDSIQLELNTTSHPPSEPRLNMS